MASLDGKLSLFNVFPLTAEKVPNQGRLDEQERARTDRDGQGRTRASSYLILRSINKVLKLSIAPLVNTLTLVPDSTSGTSGKTLKVEDLARKVYLAVLQ